MNIKDEAKNICVHTKQRSVSLSHTKNARIRSYSNKNKNKNKNKRKFRSPPSTSILSSNRANSRPPFSPLLPCANPNSADAWHCRRTPPSPLHPNPSLLAAPPQSRRPQSRLPLPGLLAYARILPDHSPTVADAPGHDSTATNGERTSRRHHQMPLSPPSTSQQAFRGESSNPSSSPSS
jgi:hypothetical protein